MGRFDVGTTRFVFEMDHSVFRIVFSQARMDRFDVQIDFPEHQIEKSEFRVRFFVIQIDFFEFQIEISVFQMGHFEHLLGQRYGRLAPAGITASFQ